MSLFAALRFVSLVRLAPLVLALLGGCLAAGAGLWLHRESDAQTHADFERSAARVAEAVKSRIRHPMFGLRGAAGVYAASDHVSRRDFRAYVESRDVPQEFPGVRGFGFIQWMARHAVPAFVAAERADEEPEFAVRELSALGEDDLYVIKYIEPAASNIGALGLDLGSEPMRREAVEHAVATGLPTLSPTFTLVQDDRRSPGFVLYLPVYRHGADPITPAQRRQALVGLLFAPMVVAEILTAVPEVATGLVHFQLVDKAIGNTIFDTADGSGSGAAGAAGASGAGRLHDERTLLLPGREMLLRVRSTAAFDAANNGAAPWMVFFGGALASALLAAALALLLRQQALLRSRAEALAASLSVDLERLAQVVQHTQNAVLTTDREQRIDWVNEGFTRLTGYSAAQVLGQTVDAAFGAREADLPAQQVLAAATARGQGCRVEVPLQAQDGQAIWLDLDMQPRRDARGALTGFMHVGTDLTKQRSDRLRLEGALRENDALLRVLHLHAIVSVADRSGRIVEANDAFCRISGYSRDELLQHTHRIVKSGVQPASLWVEMWRTITAGQPWSGEVCNRSKDGQLYWVDTLIAPFVDADGRVEKYVSIRTDITASKNAARELARERQRLNNILEGTQVGTWEWNVDTGDMVFNERCVQIVGCTLDELMPTTLQTWSQRVHPDDMGLATQHLAQHFKGELAVYEYEARLQHKAGHWVWVQSRGKLFSSTDEGRPRWVAGTLMDISERKQAEAALRASQALLDKTGRIAGVGGWAFELDTRAVVWSDETCRIHGREPGHQLGSREAIQYYAPEAREVMVQAAQHCIASGEGFDIELPLLTAQGRPIWVRSVGELERADGHPVRLVGTFQDVTARRLLQAEVHRHSERLSSVIENLPCGLIVFDAELKLVAANGEVRRLLGLPDALFAGPTTHFEDVIRFNAERGEYGPGSVEATVQAIVARARLPAQQHQFERIRPFGTPLEVRGGPMPGGGFVTTYTDISARKAAEAEVQRSAALLRGAIDAIDEAFVLFDPEDRMVFCNDKYRQVYPGTAHLMVPGVSFESMIRPGAEAGDYREAVGRVDAWVAERVAAHQSGNTTLVQALADGRTLRIVERKMPDGHIVGFRVDITEFVRATEAAQAASRSKSQFLANMSHEIRTPMNAILGMLALLKKTELTPRQADYAVKTEGAARALLGLLNDILDFSKVEAGKMTLDLHPFRTDQLLRDLAVILAANAAGKNVEVLFDIDPQLPPLLLGDAMRLQQVLINLGGNAIKFTPQGEVVVSVTVLQRSASAVQLEIAVRDSGIGIAPENQQHIFSGFSQAESSTTRRFGGTGLGLSICQRLVGLMGGELRLDSALGRGSRFHFSIELALGEDGVDAGTPALRQRQPVALRVLIVDDNAIAREVTERMGTSLGWQVTLADSGEAALACVQRDGSAFDAVFIDWQMPGLDGWQTCEQIHQHASQHLRQHTRQHTSQRAQASLTPLLIMVTAHGCEMLSQRSANEQALVHGFLVKPVTASMLYDAVVHARRDPGTPVASHPASSLRRLAGLRLLVVEDNANNQLVARELLEDEGAEVMIAANGLIAVEAVAAADPPFDVVLMDLQMPVMDGYSATRRIREDLAQQTLPIVAMTANAMASDREACLAAGMNEHVGKPFDLDHLVAVLLRLAGRQAGRQADEAGTATADATGSAAAAPRPEPAAALPAEVMAAAHSAGVDIDKALARLGGKLQVYGRTLRNFSRELQPLALQLGTQLQRGERDALRRDLHTLKGVSATVGATALAAAAAEAEAQLLPGLPAVDAAACVQRVAAALLAAGVGLEPLCAALDRAQGVVAAPAAAVLTAPDRALLAGTLKTLRGMLVDSDLDAIDALQALRVRLPSASGLRLEALEAAVEALEFDRALSRCDEWLLECVA